MDKRHSGQTASNKPCPCCSGQSYEHCCQPLIHGKRAATPLQLMRSRYSAYALENFDYIEATMCGNALKAFQKNRPSSASSPPQWYRLDIIKSSPISDDDTHGTVEFIAHYRLGQQTQQLHETSQFEKINRRWFYVDGKHIPNADHLHHRRTENSIAIGIVSRSSHLW